MVSAVIRRGDADDEEQLRVSWLYLPRRLGVHGRVGMDGRPGGVPVRLGRPGQPRPARVLRPGRPGQAPVRRPCCTVG